MKKIALIGYGAFGREILTNIKRRNLDIFFYGDYNNLNLNDIEQKHKTKCYDISKFDSKKYTALITIADSSERKTIVESLPLNTEYFTYIDKYSIIMDRSNIKIGKGSIICAGTILTTNIELGNFSQLNINTTIGHDSKIENYFTSGPGANISGKCVIGKNCYIGTNSSIKQNVKICDDVIIGMNSGVVKDINVSGIYIGTPAKYLSKI